MPPTTGFNGNPTFESAEERSGVEIDFDEERNMAGIEIIDASRRLKRPASLGFCLFPSRSGQSGRPFRCRIEYLHKPGRKRG